MSNQTIVAASQTTSLLARWKLRRTRRRAEKRRRAQLLQSKLTRSYLWVTVVAVLAIEVFISAIAAVLVFRPALPPTQTAWQANRLAAAVSTARAADKAAIQAVVSKWPRDRLALAVTDANFVVVASVPENALRAGVPLRLQPLDGALEPSAIAAMTNPAADASARSRRSADGGSIAVAPVGAVNRARFWVWVRSTPPPQPGGFWRGLLGTIFGSAIIVGIFGSGVGAGFGWFTARRLTRRLEAIEAATTAWGRGEFGVQAPVDAPDEIGQLARRLNVMADELRELVTLRQNLATAQERNRLARDLHDTVKQQVFATAMQIGAAKVLLERDTEAVRERLDAAEALARGAQSELTAILEQLRPGSYHTPLERTDALDTASDWMQIIEDATRDWARQSNITLNWQTDTAVPPLSSASGQTLQRIVQEALSNIARHSGATLVKIQWTLETSDQSTLVLEICDNGCGFAPQSALSGLGLSSMRERAESLPDGRFTLQSQPGAGTRLEVRCRASL